MPIRSDFTDATSQATVHAKHHNDLADAVNALQAGGGGGSLADAYKGEWVSTAAYAKDDIVVRNGSSYLAIEPSTGADPQSEIPTYTQVGANFDASTFDGAMNAQSTQKFTTGAAGGAVGAVGVYWFKKPTVGSIVGISSPFSGTSVIPWLGKHTITQAEADAWTTPGWFRYDLDATVTLAANTQYAFTSTDAQVGAKDQAGVPTGIVASVTPVALYGTNYDQTFSAYRLAFRLYGPPTRKWSLLASKGGKGLNPRGAWSATVTYAVDDVVTYNGSTYRAVKTTTGSTPGPTSMVWTQVAGAETSYSSIGTCRGVAQAFTVPATTKVGAVEFRIGSVTQVSGKIKVGISNTAPSGANLNPTMLAHGYVTLPGSYANGEYARAVLNTDVTLSSGTTYYVIFVDDPDDPGTANIGGIYNGSTPTATGLTLGGDYLFVKSDNTWATIPASGYKLTFRLYSGTPDTIWEVLASKGDPVATGAAPADTTTPVAWGDVTIGGTTYKVPLYQ